MVKKVYLFGHPLSHTLSPQVHNEAFQQLGVPVIYEACDLAPEEFHAKVEEIMNRPDFLGANVTIPYKEEILAHLNYFSATSRIVSAVNTVTKRNDQSLVGDNTDVPAIIDALEANGVKSIETCFIIGTGGASRSAIFALNKLGASRFVVAYRSSKRQTKIADLAKNLGVIVVFTPLNYLHKFFTWARDKEIFSPGKNDLGFNIDEKLCEMWHAGGLNERLEEDDTKKFDLLVNATPVGLFPNSTEVIIDHPNFFKMFRAVLDLVYNPEMTRLLESASLAGCQIIKGTEIFNLQATLSRNIWLAELH